MTDDGALFDATDLTPRHRGMGPAEKAARYACKAAALDDRDAAAAELLAQLARGMDESELHKAPNYARQAVAPPAIELLRELGLTPLSRKGNDAGQLEAFLAGLNEATT